MRPLAGRQGGSPNRRTVRRRKPGQRRQILRPIQQPRQNFRPGLQPIPPGTKAPNDPTPGAPVPWKPGGPIKPPETAGAHGIRANAQQALTAANTSYLDSVWRAAMQLGDPTIFTQLQSDPRFAGYQFTQDPTSLFATLARDEAQGLEDTGVGFNKNNAFYSGFRLQDEQKLRDEMARQRLAGGTSYTDALKEFASALGGAQSDYGLAMSEADQMDIDAALAAEPEDRTPGQPAGATGNTGKKAGDKKKRPGAKKRDKDKKKKPKKKGKGVKFGPQIGGKKPGTSKFIDRTV